MTQVKRTVPPAPAHHCPVCHQPQVKLQRRLTATTGGSIIYVCARSGDCAVGVNLSQVETWVAV
jgi:hypothetical protein